MSFFPVIYYLSDLGPGVLHADVLSDSVRGEARGLTADQLAPGSHGRADNRLLWDPNTPPPRLVLQTLQ